MEGQRYRPPEGKDPVSPGPELESFYTNEPESAESSLTSREINPDDLAVAGTINDPEARFEYTVENPDSVARVVETRQELKDSKGATGMTAIGDVVVKSAEERSAIKAAEESEQQILPPIPTIRQSSPNDQHVQQSQQLYRLAMIWGFIVAMMVIMAALTVWLLTG